MDTISRENNSSALPIFGILAGAIGVLLAIVSMVQISGIKKSVATHESAIAKIDSVENEARAAATAADNASKSVNKLASETQNAFTTVGNELGKINGEITKMNDAKQAPAKAAAGKGDKADKGPVVAGPDEYVIKAGDSGTKISKATGFSVQDITAVNPGLNWSKLPVGKKIKLPAKKPASS